MMHAVTEALKAFVAFMLHWVGALGYAGIVLLMALESSFVPFPSEVVIPPAAFLAAPRDVQATPIAIDDETAVIDLHGVFEAKLEDVTLVTTETTGSVPVALSPAEDADLQAFAVTPEPSQTLWILTAETPLPAELPTWSLHIPARMNLWLVILAGVAGSLIGALVNYYLAVWLGRPVLYAMGRRLPWLGLSPEKIEKAEALFRRHGEVTTFTLRLVPLVRQYISFPAGLARMHLGRFLFFTGLGASVWVTILALIGFYLGDNAAWLDEHKTALTLALLGFVVLVIVAYGWWYRRKKSRHGATTDESPKPVTRESAES